LPNQYAEVVRPQQVRVRYRGLDGTQQEMEADDLLATCIQHEIDHLEGILFVDHLSTLKRNMIMRRLAKEQRQKR
ncbi:peptide deformylase, partial [Gluconacetobacter sp.]